MLVLLGPGLEPWFMMEESPSASLEHPHLLDRVASSPSLAGTTMTVDPQGTAWDSQLPGSLMQPEKQSP